MADTLLKSLTKWNAHENYLGKDFLFGNLVGYNEHHKFFGSAMRATPDGRYAGDAISFGIGQGHGKDRKGINPLLCSITYCDKDSGMIGPSVTNVMLDEQLVTKDEKLPYHKMGEHKYMALGLPVPIFNKE